MHIGIVLPVPVVGPVAVPLSGIETVPNSEQLSTFSSIERASSWLQTRERPVPTGATKEVKSTDSARCIPGCTENNTEPIEDPLAAFVASLSDEQRRRVLRLLTREGDGSRA
jgi:hypothetical protein